MLSLYLLFLEYFEYSLSFDNKNLYKYFNLWNPGSLIVSSKDNNLSSSKEKLKYKIEVDLPIKFSKYFFI